MVEADRQIVKLAIRLNEPMARALGAFIGQYGGHSALALEALDQVDLRTIALMPAMSGAQRNITISLPRTVHRSLRRLASERGTTAGTLVNTAFANWLEDKDIPS